VAKVIRKKPSILGKLDFSFGNIFFVSAFFAGILLTIFAINISRLTFVTWRIPTLIWLLTGVFITPCFFKTLPKYLERDGFFYQLTYNILTWGGIVAYLFLALNFYFAAGETTKQEVKVVGYGKLAKGRNGCGEPYVDIKLLELEKQLFFPCGTDVSRYSAISLVLQPGLFGFYVIKDKKPSVGDN